MPGNRIKRFVILIQGRSGSSYLVQALNNHTAILCAGEKLKDLKTEGAEKQLQWARKFLSPGLFSRHRAVGFKTKLSDVLNPAAFGELLQEKQALVISLDRRNRIKMAVSSYRGKLLHEKTGRWQLYAAEDRPPPVRIGLEEFQPLLERIERNGQRMESFLQELDLPLLELYYEDLFLDQPATFAKIFAFLGVEEQPVSSNIIKNTSDDLREAILNFDEVKAHYLGTPYEAMFDEVLFPD